MGKRLVIMSLGFAKRFYGELPEGIILVPSHIAEREAAKLIKIDPEITTVRIGASSRIEMERCITNLSTALKEGNK